MTDSLGLGVGLPAICGQESDEHPANRSAETATAGTTAKARLPDVTDRRVGAALITPLSAPSTARSMGSVTGNGRPLRRGPRERRT